MVTALGDALEPFILEHECCGDLDAGIEYERVWMTCTCEVMLAHVSTDPRKLGDE